ncbi:hypothetical protein JCM10207_008275 [Rhodosporidiobolus poonsookiae]
MAQTTSRVAQSPSPTSTLSSLTPSEPSSSPSRKRPRLSSTSPPPLQLTRVDNSARPAAQKQHHAFSDLLEGLADDDFDVPPSSNPVAPREDDDGAQDDPGETAEAVQASNAAVGGGVAPGDETGDVSADDSGVALLSDVEQVKAGDTIEAEPPDNVGADGDDLEFEGDDMWLGFDDAEVGFDQPTALPSSMLSAAGAARDKGKERAAPEDGAGEPNNEEPRLVDFGFSGFGGAAVGTGGFVFATRKPLVLSEQAMQRARALLEADDEPDAASSAPSAIQRPPSRSSNRPLGPPPNPRPSSRPAQTTSAPPFPAFQSAAGRSMPLPSADALARAQERLQGSSSPLRPADPAPTSAPPPPAFVGFQNAAGRSLQMPSEEAMQRARAQLDRSSSPPPARPLSRSMRLPSRVPSRTDGRDVFAESPAPAARAAAGMSAFALPPPAARLSHSRDRGAPLDVPVGVPEVPDSPTVGRVRLGGAVSGSEETSDGPGSAGRRTPLLPKDTNGGTAPDDEQEKASSDTLQSSPHRPPTPPNPPTHVLPPIEPASPAAFPAPTSASTAPPAAPLLAPIPQRPSLLASTSRSTPSLPPSRTSSFRSPLVSHSATPSRGPSSAFTPLRPSTLSATPTFPSSTPNPLLPTQRRLNLGMTPRSKPFHLANTRPGSSTPRAASQAPPGGVGPKTGVKAFKTPFRGGRPPEGLTPAGLKDRLEQITSVRKEKVAVSSARKAGGAVVVSKEDEAKRLKARVFELDADGSPRFNLLNFGMRPQTHYYEHLETLRIPPAILDMDVSSGASYVFPCGRSAQSASTALQELVTARMPDEKALVTMPWVQNHWNLVLWKLASYVRSRPDLLTSWWTFERVMEQLRYRYEREINLAQRSAIKRIQEQDSPASLPMFLCVSQIRWDEPADDAISSAPDADPTLVIVGLELTDGWYRIRASIDKTLQSACERGKIVVGSKLAVQGAKLVSAKSEGTDVLRALGHSTLQITGNSTSLAPWHATLGFRREQFVASLSSLTSAGGLVPLVDVVIERAYPCGYVDLRKGRGTETWGEEEELAKAEEWKRGRKKIEARLADEREKAGTEEDELVELLQEAAEGLEPGLSRHDSTSSEDPDEILDRLESASNKRALIRKLSPGHVRSTLALAVENAQASRYRAVEELQKELAEKYPPRDVRGFRVVRVRDGRDGQKGSTRTALLTVWDAQSFEEGFFKEGGRYLISNTMPKGTWRTGDAEISLTTRRDSRWRKL